MPGETIKFGQGNINGTLFVKNGDEFYATAQPIDNEYVVAGNYPVNEITLGNDEYYVLGDNRNNSSDSRDPSVGVINKNRIIFNCIFFYHY